MEEIELSVMIHTPGTAAALQTLLDEFKSQTNIKVNLTCLDWETARGELNKAALHHHGPDVSEVGSTWVPDLISMDVLNPLPPYEIGEAGNASEYAEACWSTAQMPDDNLPWALPWHAETYVIHYRKDLLAQAGVDEAAAFRTHAEIETTAAKLAKIGVPAPVELTLQTDRFGTLHTLASWIWAKNAEFLSADGKRLLLNQPRLLQAVQAYFGLLQHASAEGRQAMLTKVHTPLFHQGHAAITFGTIRMAMPDGEIPEQVSKNWGWASLPQPCFVGGSNLVLWKHCRNKRAAFKLLAFLSEPANLQRSSPAMATLPPRLSALRTAQYTQDPMLKVMSEAVRHGRAYPSLRLWGLLEDKLVAALLDIGSQVLSSPPEAAQEIVEREIENITHRVEMVLSS